MGGSAATKALVNQLIKENHVMVFSKSYCPYCNMAKDALNEAGAKYKVIELDSRDDGSQIQQVLKNMTGASSVPRVFIKGNCIGGGSETKKLQEEKRLKSLCQS